MGKNESLAVYYPQIDSIRAIAVLFVLFHHYFTQKVTGLVPLGEFGVDIFFTLSGFLITGILISYRSIKSPGTAIKKFYFRRILRIFPVYYLYIFIAVLIFGREIPQKIIFWASIYGLNFYMINHGLITKYVFTHFWSLAVEEQFYLVWPFIILFLPFRYLKKIIVLAILISIGFTYLNINIQLISYHPVSCMQALATGGLVKYYSLYDADKIMRFRKNLNLFLQLFISLWICTLFIYDLGVKYAYPVLRIFASLSTAVVLIKIIFNLNGKRMNKFLNSGKLQFIGRISYGIYVYHILVLALVSPIIQKLVINFTTESNPVRYNLYLIAMPLCTGISIFVAWLSFRVIESPINRLKNYKRDKKTEVLVPVR